MTCKHETTASGPHYGFTGSVAVHPYTDENPAAHGGITYTETCQSCGRTRDVNTNGWHSELGPWGGRTFAEQREDQDRKERARRAKRRRVIELRGCIPDSVWIDRTQVWIDDNGYLCCIGPEISGEDIATAEPELFRSARELRLAVIAAEEGGAL